MSNKINNDQDAKFMRRAIELAARAEAEGEVPVGCVIVRDGRIIGQGWNRMLGESDATAHAEICAIRSAGSGLGNYRLVNCDLYVTLEPCVMCVGAIIHARLARIAFGASDPKTGAAGSVFDLLGSAQHNHRPEITAGVLASQCSTQLGDFFKRRRKENKSGVGSQ